MGKPLVYDVGMNNGDDTKFYLRRGYKVVAVEAAPDLADEARRKFKRQVERGDLIIENVGIADHEGYLDFWMCQGNSIWNSFVREKAATTGGAPEPVKMPCTTLDRLMSVHGRPYYCKIDIEGYDHHAVASLKRVKPPKYISMEFGHRRAVEDIRTLRDLGYTGFKLIEQLDFDECNRETIQRFSTLPDPTFKRKLKAKRAINKVCRKANMRLPFYAAGSSGPFGDMLPGSWCSFDETLELAAQLIAFDKASNWGGMGWWFDIHATRA